MEPLLCETLRHTGACLKPVMGDLCVMRVGPGPDDGAHATVLSTHTGAQAGRHGERVFDATRRVEWEMSSVDLDVEHGLSMRATFDWFGSFDPLNTPADFVPSRVPEAAISGFAAGESGPRIDTELENLMIRSDTSWLAFQWIAGEVDQTFVSYALMTGTEGPFVSNYLVWGALESTPSEP